MAGRALEVVWRDRYAFGVRPGQREAVDEALRFRAPPFAVPADVAQAVAGHLGLPPGQLATIAHPDGSWLFHFWGDLYGALLAAVLEARLPPDRRRPPVEALNAYALLPPFVPPELPPWDEGVVTHQLYRLARHVEPYLDMGRFHALLPPELARQAVVAQCNAPCFEALYRASTVVEPSAGLRDALLALV